MNAAPLDAPDSAGPNRGIVAGVAALAAGVFTVGGSAWYVRRRWAR